MVILRQGLCQFLVTMIRSMLLGAAILIVRRLVLEQAFSVSRRVASSKLKHERMKMKSTICRRKVVWRVRKQK